MMLIGVRRGFLLATVLLLSILLLVMGMGYIGGLVRQYQSTFQAALACQARGLARTGLEDARIKLVKDGLFPPAGAADQQIFTYSENVTDLDGTTLIGSYTISIDTSFRAEPYAIIRVTSTGQTGPRSNPTAQNTISATLNLSKTDPAKYFRYLRWEDRSSY